MRMETLHRSRVKPREGRPSPVSRKYASPVTSDSGYAYTLAGIGIIGIVIFWVLLLSIRGYGRRFYLFRDMIGFFFALLLCISNSPFTIKTGALLWFLVGVLSRGYSFRHSRRGPPVTRFAHS
jgi:hypothetical protein